jgi:hypothetical protein
MLIESKITQETQSKVRSIRNVVLKEYLCLKKPALLHNLAKNHFPTPRAHPKINFIDVDAISTDSSNSLPLTPKSPPTSLTPELALASVPEGPSLAIHHPNCASNFQTAPAMPRISQCYIESLLVRHGLTMEHHYSSFLPSDKKYKKISGYLANYEQIVFSGKIFCENCESEKYSDFISGLKVVLVLIMGSWPVLTRYAKCDQVAAILLVLAAQLSNLPKKCIYDSFKLFDDENFNTMKIRHLRKSKLYNSAQEIIKSAMA